MMDLIQRLTFMCVLWAYHFQPAATRCINDVFLDWKFENASSQPAANVTIAPGQDHYGRIATVRAYNTTGHLKIWIFAIPYVENQSDCPPRYQLTEHLADLRRHSCPKQIGCSICGYIEVSFSRAFAGCYYVVLGNDKEEKWIVGPQFFGDSDFRYLNTKVTATKWIVKPEDTESNKELITELKVPLPCIKVEALLYGGKGHIQNVTHGELRKKNETGAVKEQQDCLISKDTEKVNISCDSKSDIGLEVVGNSYTRGEDEWTTIIKWTNLRSGGNTYYLRFEPDATGCFSADRIKHINVTTWTLVVNNVFCDLGYLDDDNQASSVEKSYTSEWVATESVITIVALAYWIYKFSKLVVEVKRRTYATRDKSPQTITIFADQEEPNEILLIYVKSSNLFARAMRNFGRQLAQNCCCHVHDLHANCEGNLSMELGAEGWIEKLLRDGSKVVWVDTPEFRSQLNDKDKQRNVGDFRDYAIPYAVSLATNLFQNATTQYRRHFVVRVEGFEVDDGRDDPLLVVSPYARYYIPKHLSLLNEHLGRGPLVPLENTANTEE